MPRRPITKAILLAAGFGTRMRPLSYNTPKPMMPLWGKPLIGHAIDLVRSWGVREILVNTHHAPESLLHYCRERSSADCRIQISFEPEILGTGGALKRADWFIGDGPFWMLNTDIAADLDPTPLVRAFHREKAIAALWMHGSAGPRTVEMDGRRILNFASPTPGADNTYTFCGLQLLSPRIFNHLPKTDFCSVIDAYRNSMQREERVLGIALPDTFWADLGSPERYLATHRDILAARKRRIPGKRLLPPKELRAIMARIPDGVAVSGFAAIGEGVKLGANVTVEDSVLWDGAVVRRGSRIVDGIVGKNTDVHGQITDSTAVRTDTLPHDPALTKCLSTLLPSDLRPPTSALITLPGRGSDRSFERIQTPRTSGILVRYDDSARSENARYASHARLLSKHGIRVPKVLLDLPGQKATLYEDVGSEPLDATVHAMGIFPHNTTTASPVCSAPVRASSRPSGERASGAETSLRRNYKHITKLYQRVLDQLVLLHSIPRRVTSRVALEPPFDAELYAWERNLFAAHFLRGHLELPRQDIRQIDAELSPLADTLLSTPCVLLHRDMQSSNVLLKGRDLAIIDFQGMRMGPAAYDVASLLCDPYVMLDAKLQDNLLDYYLDHAPHAESTQATFHAAAIQRLAQALGAYGRLSALPQTRRFAQHIQPACTMMLRMIEHLDGLPHLTALLTSNRNLESSD